MQDTRLNQEPEWLKRKDASVWFTINQAAEWLSCSTWKVSGLAKEMEALDEYCKGVFREGRPFLRINKAAMNDYLFHRKALKLKGRKDARKEKMAG